MNLFWILRFGKNSGLICLETENKMKYDIKKTSLKHWATGFEILR